MKTRFELGTLGVIEGDHKRMLENYIDERLFRQRKSYDEYYIDVTSYEVDIELGDLMLLGETFKVVVLEDAIIIADR
jgi:hypothetical protein